MIKKTDNVHVGIEKLAGAGRVHRIANQIKKSGGWESASPGLQDAFNRAAEKYHKRWYGKHRQLGFAEDHPNWLIRAHVKGEKDYARRYWDRIGMKRGEGYTIQDMAAKARKAGPDYKVNTAPYNPDHQWIKARTLRGDRVPDKKVRRWARPRGLRWVDLE